MTGAVMRVLAILIVIQIGFATKVCANIQVAVTVDDLPAHAPIPPGESRLAIVEKIIAALKKHNVPEAYGFINGGKVNEDPSLEGVFKLWTAAGYPLANHLYDHWSLNDLSVEQYIERIETNIPFLQKYNGTMDWKYFRYPFLHEGETLDKRNAIRAYLTEQKYRIAHVTIDTRDWAWNETYARCEAKGIENETFTWMKSSFVKYGVDNLLFANKLSTALFQRQVPQILLLHLGVFDAIQLDELLTQYEKEGVTFVTLSSALKDPAYAINPGLANRNGSEFTFQVLKSRNLELKDVGVEPIEHFPWEKLNQLCR